MPSIQKSPPAKAINKLPRKAGKTEIISQEFAFCAGKRARLPDVSAFSRLGFDSISSSKNRITLRKVQSTNLIGQPHKFVEIEFFPNRATLRYSCPPDSDGRIRRLHACLLFSQAAYLLPGFLLDAKSLSELALPSLECASATLSSQYESLSKSRADLAEESAELSLQNRRLQKALEESASQCAALERQSASLAGRVAQLECVPDHALDEMIVDWLLSHRGSLNLAHFSRANGIPAARCEERLSALMKKGAVRKSGGAFAAEPGAGAGREFAVAKGGLSGLARLLQPRR